MYDYEAPAAATRRTVLDLQPDSVNSPNAATAQLPSWERLREGHHVIRTGGKCDSHPRVPMIPEE